MVGTKARYPVTRFAIFKLQGSNIVDPPVIIEESKAQFLEPHMSSLLKPTLTIEALPFYADRILASASTSDDYCYLLTPYSIILVRLESNIVTEIYTSTLGLTIKSKFKEDAAHMFYPDTT